MVALPITSGAPYECLHMDNNYRQYYIHCIHKPIITCYSDHVGTPCGGIVNNNRRWSLHIRGRQSWVRVTLSAAIHGAINHAMYFRNLRIFARSATQSDHTVTGLVRTYQKVTKIGNIIERNSHEKENSVYSTHDIAAFHIINHRFARRVCPGAGGEGCELPLAC